MFTSKKLFLSLLLLSTLQTAYSTGWFTAAPKPSFFGWLFTPTPQPTFVESTQALITENPKTTLGIIAVGAATVYGTKRFRELKNENACLTVNLNGVNVMLAEERQAKNLANQAYFDMSEQLGKVTTERDLLQTELACLTAQKKAAYSDTFDA